MRRAFFIFLMLFSLHSVAQDYSYYWRLRNFRMAACGEYALKYITVQSGEWTYKGGRYFMRYNIVFKERKQGNDIDILWKIGWDFAVNVLDSTTADCNVINVAYSSWGIGNGVSMHHRALIDSARLDNKKLGLNPLVQLQKIIPAACSDKWLDKEALSIRCRLLANYCSAKRHRIWFSGAVGAASTKSADRERIRKGLYDALKAGKNDSARWQLCHLDFDTTDMSFTGSIDLKE